MQDAALVRRTDRVGEWNRDPEQSVERHPAFRDQLVQRLPVHELHRQEGCLAGLIDRVQRDDVRVVERGDGARFALETLAAGGGHTGRQDFERYLTAERQILGEIHLAHAPAPKEPDDSIVRERIRRH